MHAIITGAAAQIDTQIVEELSATHDLCLIDCAPVSNRKSTIADLSIGHSRSRWKPGWPLDVHDGWKSLKEPTLCFTLQ